MKLESLIQYLDRYLGIPDFPDYPGAVNGLQVEGPAEVGRVIAAVDASLATIDEAVRRGGDLLLVHHGLFWGGGAPITGRRFRKLAALIRGEMAVYAAHLPLDAHAEVGNCAVLARALGVSVDGRFGTFQGADIGWWGRIDAHRDELARTVERTVEGPVMLIPGGPERVARVGVVTGGGGALVEEAARAGLDAFVTGEGSHHTYFDATELGVNVYYAGHYRTEVWGVRALAEHLEASFGLDWEFVDLPTGL